MLPRTAPTSKEEFLAGGSQLSELINTRDWRDTPLGAMEAWPQSLKTSVNLILNSQHPMWIGWGPEAIFLYNDAYISVLSEAKHPWALGKPASEVWSEIWDVCGPLADKVFKQGKPTYMEDVRLFMNRGDYLEETYYSFSYSPIYDEQGTVAGLFCPSAETTAKVLHARRLKTLSELSTNTLVEKTIRGACLSAFRTVAKNTDDIPFAILYLVDNDRRIAHLEAATGLPERSDTFMPQLISTHASRGTSLPWPVADVVQTRVASIVSLEGAPIRVMGSGEHPVSDAIVLPVMSGHEAPVGVLIAGINPCRKLDTDYRTFFDLLSNQIATALQNARAAEEERKRIEMLAELDRAKTVFFSNVSHEFRTPLTLMLGPIENILNKSADRLPPEDREALQATHRNAMRLFRLVNTLLDFSRIEAGRIAAAFSRVDLKAFTTDLASNFRSVLTDAGLEYDVDCGEITAPAYVDSSMWEKIVFNLLSNAFKFTLKGKITLSLKQSGDEAVLKVADTGIGIPAEEMPNLFQRFHRVKNAAGRTFEGTGIGLSLVKELVELHRGTVGVQSQEGVGTEFTVRIPLGKEHLPEMHVVERNHATAGSSLATVYVKELESLMGAVSADGAASHGQTSTPSHGKKHRILIVDDNADMRQYMRRMLSDSYHVDEAENGQHALSKLKDALPDLVISDIMMPVMDGIEFMKTVKGTPAYMFIPVILLSARAGEEARIEGYELGADDYLVKPFSVNELHARVKAQIRIAKARYQAETHLRNLFQQAPVIIVVLRGPEFVVEIANEKLLEYWDKTLDQVLYRRLVDILPEVAGQGLLELLTDVLTEGARHVENERLIPIFRNGRMETTYVSYVYEPLRDEEGRITHVMVLANDVTDSVRARQKIELSEMKFRNLVTQAPVGIAILKGRDFVVEIANESYLGIAQRTAAELVGKPVFDVLSELRATELPKFLAYVLDTGESYFGAEFPVQFNRNGKLDLAYFNFVYQPLREENKVTGIICVVVEVTEIVRSRQLAQNLATELEHRVEERTTALRISNQKLEASNRELEQFAFIASHDLQEPLRKIQTFSELLQKNLGNPEQVDRYIRKIEGSAARMSVLIKDVLNFSKLSGDGQPIVTVDLNDVVRHTRADLELLIEETGASIRCEKLPSVPGITTQLQQLFANLINNSIKFRKDVPVIDITSTDVTGKEISEHPGLIAGRKYVRLTFADNGIGFEPEYADKIFVIFQRLHDRKQAGTGIGLALCKKIVEVHGGVIEAHGQPGKGATFIVYLPKE